MCQFVRAAITRYQRLSGLTEIYFIAMLGARKFKITVQQGSVSSKSFLPALQVARLLCVQVATGKGRREISFISYKATSFIKLGFI